MRKLAGIQLGQIQVTLDAVVKLAQGLIPPDELARFAVAHALGVDLSNYGHESPGDAIAATITPDRLFELIPAITPVG